MYICGPVAEELRMCGWGPYTREASVWEACQWCYKHVVICHGTAIVKYVRARGAGGGDRRARLAGCDVGVEWSWTVVWSAEEEQAVAGNFPRRPLTIAGAALSPAVPSNEGGANQSLWLPGTQQNPQLEGTSTSEMPTFRKPAHRPAASLLRPVCL